MLLCVGRGAERRQSHDDAGVAFKPTATIMREQNTVSVVHEDTTIKGRGRHDPCVLPRAVPMVEAMATLVLADHALRQLAIGGGPK